MVTEKKYLKHLNNIFFTYLKDADIPISDEDFFFITPIVGLPEKKK